MSASSRSFPTGGTIVWQTRHYVLARLARYFHVIWCNPGARQRPWAFERSGKNRATPPGLIVHDPPSWIRELNRPAVLGRLTTRERFRGARRTLAQRGAKTIVLSLWRPHTPPPST